MDDPVSKLINGLTAYWGSTDADGAAGGTTWIDAALLVEPDYTDHYIKILSGDAAGQGRPITGIVAGTGTVAAFTDAAGAPIQIVAGTRYVILNQDSSIFAAVLAGLAVPAADAVGNVLERDVIGNKTDTAVIVVDAVSSIMRYIKGIVNQVAAIIAAIAAFFTLQETGATVTLDGTEQNMYFINAPAAVYKPLTIKVDLTNLTVAETVVIREYDRNVTGGGLVQVDENTYVGVQAIPTIYIHLVPNRWGIQTTIQRTAGGVVDVIWEVLYEA